MRPKFTTHQLLPFRFAYNPKLSYHCPYADAWPRGSAQRSVEPLDQIFVETKTRPAAQP